MQSVSHWWDPSLKRNDIDGAITKVKGQIDSLANSQQMDTLRLQSLSAKRNEAFEQMTNPIKKMVMCATTFSATCADFASCPRRTFSSLMELQPAPRYLNSMSRQSGVRNQQKFIRRNLQPTTTLKHHAITPKKRLIRLRPV